MKNLSEKELRILEKQEIDCRDVTTLLGDYVDNDLTSSLRDRVHEHIRCCAECAEGETRYREVISLAKTLPETPVPAGVNQRLREALNRRLKINLSLE